VQHQSACDDDVGALWIAADHVGSFRRGAAHEQVEQRFQALAPKHEAFAGNIRLAPADPLPWPFVMPDPEAPSAFVPLLLVGGCLGNAFGQSVVHSNAVGLYAAVGMAAFIAGGYKTPLTAVVFVAETTGGHSFLIPSLIGAAIAYAISGEASVSGDQHLHETVKIAELATATVAEVMQKEIVGVPADTSVRDFRGSIAARRILILDLIPVSR